MSKIELGCIEDVNGQKIKSEIIDTGAPPIIFNDKTAEAMSIKNAINDVIPRQHNKNVSDSKDFIHKLSYIEPHEEKQAKKLIEEHLGFELPRVAGWKMLVKPYIRPEDIIKFKNDDGTDFLSEDGKPVFLALPEKVRADDKWKAQVALVVAQGPLCFKGDRYKGSDKWCRVGDWITLGRSEGVPIVYRGVPMKYILDDSMLGTVPDPEYIAIE